MVLKGGDPVRIKELRLAHRLLQRDVAQLLNVSRASYSLYESEKVMPTLDMLMILADHYGVSLDYLVGRPEEKASGAMSVTAAERQLVEDFRGLSAQGREYVLQSMEMAVKIYGRHSDLPDVEGQTVREA